MRALLSPALVLPAGIGVGVAAAIIACIWLLGLSAGREPDPPWVCDDTRYIDTVPAGRGVAGPAVSAPPGCG
ncbi:MAG: hypothetical protein M3O34_09295 [Chloroflexota bacterium]|nr:hypothetical protein [Chloroflexota bacterium]